MSRLAVTLVKSPIGNRPAARATVIAMGLRRLHQTVIVPDNASVRGMVTSIAHLLRVEAAPEASEPRPAKVAQVTVTPGTAPTPIKEKHAKPEATAPKPSHRRPRPQESEIPSPATAAHDESAEDSAEAPKADAKPARHRAARHSEADAEESDLEQSAGTESPPAAESAGAEVATKPKAARPRKPAAKAVTAVDTTEPEADGDGDGGGRE
jgi:large subunit ribosomal protein L30